MRAVLLLLVVGVLVASGLWWFRFEHRPPQASLVTPVEAVGRNTPIDVAVSSDTPGLRSITVRLQSGGSSFELLNQSYPKLTWRGSGIFEQKLHIVPDLVQLKVPEGPATIEVIVDTYAWHVLQPKQVPVLSVPTTIDLTPPRIELLTTQHNARLGGVELLIFRQSPDTSSSAVVVDKYSFPVTLGMFADRSIAVAFFAIPQDLTDDARPQLVARDAAGNERKVAVPCTIKPRQFAERTLAIDDNFLARKVPDMQHENGLPITADLLQGYLAINNNLRRQNEAQIHDITAHSQPAPLWDGAFHRQSNSAPLSSFADRRSYTYHGEVVDHQTHLGFDLASLKLSSVEAAQHGLVVFAGNLGIYGNAVILDHGLGVFSLYGHLSSIAVQVGEHVKTAQSLGQTGETGLAGGDHLHFSIMLWGVHVDPVEWWDPHWLHDHVTPKLTMFPRTTAAPAGEHEQTRP